jgi:hypothetical protein
MLEKLPVAHWRFSFDYGKVGIVSAAWNAILLSVLYTMVVCKVRGLDLLLRVGTLWKCGNGLFFEVLPLASDVLLTKLNPLLENVLQTVCRKLQDDSGTSGFLPRSSLFMVGKAQKSHGARSGLYDGC